MLTYLPTQISEETYEIQVLSPLGVSYPYQVNTAFSIIEKNQVGTALPALKQKSGEDLKSSHFHNKMKKRKIKPIFHSLMKIDQVYQIPVQ